VSQEVWAGSGACSLSNYSWDQEFDMTARLLLPVFTKQAKKNFRDLTILKREQYKRRKLEKHSCLKSICLQLVNHDYSFTLVCQGRVNATIG
jgi:hypothetical protein